MLPAVLGSAGVWLALVGALCGVVVCAAGLVRGRVPSRLDARLLAVVVLVGALLAVGAMEVALVTHDFHLVYVADNNATATPLIYSITGLWSSLAGSILLWGLVLAVFCGLVVWRYRRRAHDDVVRWATLVMYAVAAFFFGLMVGPANPFLSSAAPLRGAGPNALLQDNPLVAIHPPLLYTGFVGFTVPFAFAIGMLATGRVGEQWQAEVRRWTLISWTALSVGIVLGAWWSYQVLGWGGFWGWDPVENAALLPWLCGTAYLHSVLVQERRGLLRVWNLSLSIATFALTILGTFLTRSGVVVSVHAFSESDLGPVLIAFFLLVVVSGFGLIAWRGDRLRSPVGVDAPLGREGAFLVNNLVLVGFAFVVLLGTLFPLLYQALENQAVTVGAPYFDTVAVPAGLALLLLMAVAPALSWRKVDAGVLWGRLALPAWSGVVVVVACVAAGVRGVEPLLGFGLAAFAAASALRSLVLAVRASTRRGAGPWRGLVGRTNGGMVVHLGVVVLAVGLVAASSFRSQAELVLRPGKVAHFAGHTFMFEGLRTVDTPQRLATEAIVRVDGGGPFTPAVSQYGGPSSQAVGTPAIDSGFFGDVYLTWDATGRTGKSTGGNVVATLPKTAIALGAIVEPLMGWMWAGGMLVGLGGLLAMVPGTRRRATDPVSALAPLVAGAAPDPGSRPGSEPEPEPEPEPVPEPARLASES
ncbi:MAG TPA: cytochrome c-type biogenesis CcmF C-terminal domain-containing protein [Acidimicrobiales bacterium]|nr:cytochrome c-type biogenesis CcmF C-terminal domain-containing protein [Acidimicrobiales bacterium]